MKLLFLCKCIHTHTLYSSTPFNENKEILKIVFLLYHTGSFFSPNLKQKNDILENMYTFQFLPELAS